MRIRADVKQAALDDIAECGYAWAAECLDEMMAETGINWFTVSYEAGLDSYLRNRQV